jgi:assimilatory nitrate reductase catalytic subunit
MSAVTPLNPDSCPTKTNCPYCGVGCGILASVEKNKVLTIKGDPEHPANFGRLCSKGSALAETVDLEGRLLTPEVNGEQTDWNTALDKVASEFSRIIKTHGPDAVAFYVSGQLLTEDYYVANKLMKGFIGSANIDTNSRLCMSSAVAGYKRAFGSDTVPCDYEDLESADLIILSGSNAAWCHPVVFQRMQKAKDDRPELKIVVIDPRTTASCEIADLHLPIKPGKDVHLFNGLLNHLRKEDACDWEYLEQHTEGFSAALKTARESSPSIPSIASVCGLDEKDVVEFYRLFSRTEKVVTVYSQGINQSSSGTDKVNSIINCHLATGRIGKPGMGPFSITGQPNAMGGREVGGLSNQLAAHMELENPEHREIVQRFWNSPVIADKAGLKAVDLFRAIEKGDVKAVWIMATNPVVSMPDANQVRAAIEKCELVVVSDCIKNTDTTELADVLLPAAAWGEKDGTVTNSERRISRQRAFLETPGQARPDWWIVSQVAQRLGHKETFAYQTPADIFREHAALTGIDNNGTRDLDLHALQSISNNDYLNFSPTQWPITDKTKTGRQQLLAESQFYTPSKKAQLIAVTPKDPGQMPDVEFPMILNTGRVRDQWHTMTRTGKSPRLSTHTIEPSLDIHPQDAARFAIPNNSLVKISSRYGGVIVRAIHSSKQQSGSVFMPIHWNYQFGSTGSIGKVVNPFTDPLSGQPESKHTPVKIELFKAQWQAFLMLRNEIEIPALSYSGADYWVKAKGLDFWRYELAGLSIKDNREDLAKKLLQSLAEETECIEYIDEASSCYRIAHIKNNRLEKCLFVASSYEKLPGRAWLGSLFNQNALSPAERVSLLAGKPPAGQLDAGPTVCACFNVGKNKITSCLENGHANTVEGVGELLQAGTYCGSCIPELKELIKENVMLVPANAFLENIQPKKSRRSGIY